MKQGDFITIDFVGKLETGKVFDFTQESVAKQEGVHDSKRTYKPALVILGAGMVIPGVEKQLEQMNVGEERSFTVEYADGFGPRNPRLSKVFSLTHFLKQKINPVPGDFVQIEGLQGKVQSVSGGRVRVDFNHPLAGKNLEYWIKIVSEITNKEDKIAAVFEHYHLDYTFTLKEGVLTVKSKGEIPQQAKDMVQETVTKWIKGITRYDFQEKSG